MEKFKVGLIFAILISVTIVTLDLFFFRDQTTQRFMANVGVTLIFGAFYWKFFKK